MKAIVYTEYGSPDVLRLQEVEKPNPKDNEILVRVYATPVNYGDLTARNFAHLTSNEFNMPAFLWLPSRMAFGWNKPKINILGSELAGEVEAIGKSVSKFKPGDQVFAYLGMKMGANAEYVCIPEDGTVALKPMNMTYEEASALPYGAIMATSLLRKANLQPGQKVLINGASGGIGSLALQLAKYFGTHVTGVCGTPRLEYVRSLGADRVIDYNREDFTRNGETYDLIFDILGRSSFTRCKNSLTSNGIYLLASFKMKPLFQMLWTSMTGSRKKVICALANEKVEDLVLIRELVEAGKIKTIIDKCYPLEQAADAHRYVENGHKQGNVVLTVDHKTR
ncbi:MAG TPA: NAD(P)-dependent alcohol dehydrogenase [Anaerolineales bacterium]|nr:NAD(P)-dependent alcohol dehydrogenase [Anaerolineales bacterium]